MVFRLPPNLESHRYDTYGVVSPRSTHTRPAKCEEMNSQCTAQLVDENDPAAFIICNERHCGPWAHGWQTLIDVGTSIGQQRARYIIDHSGRHWTAQQTDTAVTFTFPAGQQCFSEHRLPLERLPLFTFKNVHSYDPDRARIIDGYEWLDRFGENQIKLREIIERG